MPLTTNEPGPNTSPSFTGGLVGGARRLATRCRSRMRLAAVAHLAAFTAAFGSAVLIRFDLRVPTWLAEAFWPTLFYVVAIKMGVFALASQFKAWWGHVSFRDLVSLGQASSWSLLCLVIANQCGLLPVFVPRLVLLADFAATILYVGAERSIWRCATEFAVPWLKRHTYHRALLVGAGTADKIVSLQLQLHPELPLRICGFLDQTASWPGQRFGGVPVLGTIDQLLDTARARRASEVIVVAGSLPGGELRRLRAQCESAGLRLHVLPPPSQMVSSHKLLNVKPLDVESLLQREPVRLDDAPVREALRGGVALVTGAGGSIGSEICRQLVRFAPREVVIVDRSEPSLFAIDRELRTSLESTPIITCLGDITDEPRMRAIFRAHRPTIVFHVAAHKHVPLLETHVGEAIKNNVFGAALLAELADEMGVERFVYISTDKAVNPSSIMGVSKRISENYVMALAEHSSTRFVVVRFGNVLGSVGSVAPIFYEQIRQGGPITLTHPEMNRYFMTIAEASQLVLQAGSIGGRGQIFVLDMGQPILILDLAKQMIRMAGLPEHAIDIEFVGMRPGEKLSEQLYADDERPLPTPHAKLFAAHHRAVSLHAMRHDLDVLRQLVEGEDAPLLEKLREMTPEYASPERDRDDAVLAANGDQQHYQAEAPSSVPAARQRPGGVGKPR